MLVQPKSKSGSKNKEIKESWDVDEVDPTLNLRDNIKSSKNHIKSSIKSNHERANIKKQLSLELLNEIIKNQNISNEEKEKIKDLIEKINEKKYYYCYDDLSGSNADIIRFFEESEKIIERPLLIHLPEELDYDVEFYKIGKTCNGLKKRYAVIKRGGFYSSKKPIIQMDRSKLKDKTEYLPGSEVIIETKDDQRRSQGEWSNKK